MAVYLIKLIMLGVRPCPASGGLAPVLTRVSSSEGASSHHTPLWETCRDQTFKLGIEISSLVEIFVLYGQVEKTKDS